MKYKAIIILTIICAVGCQKKEVEQLPVKEETTLEEETTSVVAIENTEYPDYVEYRKQWKRVNSHPTKGYRLVDGKIVKIEEEPVVINADEMPFSEIFNIQYRAHGEGHMFWWRGNQYTTNLKELNNEG